jgi:2'-5' RNA ligase
MSDLVIVAIPADTDPVWKFSSEKVPHMTLLFLGANKDQAKMQRISDFVEHASTTVQSFFLGVDRRGPLGPDNADVLFFEDSFSMQRVREFRSSLLANEEISKAYEAAQQFPEWTPHLTMGFPATPAKIDTRDDPGFRWVDFDRIALWTGDSQGPTFQLKPWTSMMPVAPMSMSEPLSKMLSHHGIKGMHWGVRKEQNGSSQVMPMTIKVEPGISKSTKEAAISVGTLMHERYGQNINNVKILGPGNPEYPDSLAYIDRAPKDKKGTFFIQKKDLTSKMAQLKKTGWMAPETSNVRGLLTHESGHLLLHADEQVKNGFFGPKTTGEHAKASKAALRAAMKQATKDGENILNLSGYAGHAQSREEVEAELFSQYHWVKNPPKYVTVWGETLHKELGVDPTPFWKAEQNG